jgi:Type II secretory pathway, component PulK
MRRRQRSIRLRARGFVMVQALVIVALLLALLAVVVNNQRVTLEASQAQLRQRRAEVAARSALALAVATLETANPDLVTKNDDWAVLGDDGSQAFEVGDAAGTTYRLQIVDAGAFVNVNTATEDQLERLPLTQEQIDSLLDWREPSLQPRALGAKDDYYNGMPQPYNARLGRLTTLSELLLVKGWTGRTLYSPPSEDGIVTTARMPEGLDGNPLPLASLLTVESGMPNSRADGTGGRTNLSQGQLNVDALTQLGIAPAVAEAIVQRAPYTTWRDLLSVPGLTTDAVRILLDSATVTAGNRMEGKINLNTAPEAVLETVLGLAPDVASALAARQDTGLLSLGEITTVPGLTTPQIALIADSVGVGSDTWIVRAYGESGGVGVAIEATVGLRGEQARILTYERLNNPEIPGWWDWETEPTDVQEGPPAAAGRSGGGRLRL